MADEIDFLMKCNGEGIRNDYSPEAVAVLNEHADYCRGVFKSRVKQSGKYDEHYGPRYLFGSRFNTNERVLARIATKATEAEFLQNPTGWILDALRDCASADHWYKYEKDYGDDD